MLRNLMPKSWKMRAAMVVVFICIIVTIRRGNTDDDEKFVHYDSPEAFEYCHNLGFMSMEERTQNLLTAFDYSQSGWYNAYFYLSVPLDKDVEECFKYCEDMAVECNTVLYFPGPSASMGAPRGCVFSDAKCLGMKDMGYFTITDQQLYLRKYHSTERTTTDSL